MTFSYLPDIFPMEKKTAAFFELEVKNHPRPPEDLRSCDKCQYPQNVPTCRSDQLGGRLNGGFALPNTPGKALNVLETKNGWPKKNKTLKMALKVDILSHQLGFQWQPCCTGMNTILGAI